MHDDGATEEAGRLDEALFRPPLILRCERAPFLVLAGGAAFLVITAFGVTVHGLVGGALLLAAGLMVLRRVAEHDPFWFAAVLAAARFPRRMPEALPDPVLPRHVPFVGYGDAPPRGAAIRARALAAAALAAAGTVAGLLAGPVAGLATACVLGGALLAAVLRAGAP